MTPSLQCPMKNRHLTSEVYFCIFNIIAAKRSNPFSTHDRNAWIAGALCL